MVEILGKDYENLDYIYNFVPVLNNSLNLEKKILLYMVGDYQRIKEFLKAGNFYWNSGMFCFKAGVFLEELKRYEPEVYEKAKIAFDNSNNAFLPLDKSMEIPSISVDYAVMERTQNLQAVIGSFRWSDMGSFESVYEYLLSNGHSADKFGNIVIGTFLHTEFLGLENTILVVTEDVILVLKKEYAQKVKDIYENLEKTNKHLM